MKKLKDKISLLELNYEKDLSQLKINYNDKIIEQEEQISDLIEKVDSIQTDEVLLQKLEYWKEKAHSEIKRVENLEKQIVAHVDALTMAKIFV